MKEIGESDIVGKENGRYQKLPASQWYSEAVNFKAEGARHHAGEKDRSYMLLFL